MTKIETIIDALEGVNLQDIEIYDMRGKSPFYDFLVISSATNNRQLNATIAHIQEGLSKNNYAHARVEGKDSNSWILVDCKEIIVNIFTKEERTFYNIEKMLLEVPKVELKDL